MPRVQPFETQPDERTVVEICPANASAVPKSICCSSSRTHVIILNLPRVYENVNRADVDLR